MLTREQIATRAAREIQNGASVYLDPGWAELVRAALPADVQVTEPQAPDAPVDVALISATTVTASGGLAGTTFTGTAPKLIAIVEQHQGDDGAAHLLSSEEPPGGLKAHLLITNLAVFEVTPEGLVMREVAPGVSALDVQLKSEAHLLAADDLKVIHV
jgi:acyl CoA:acetate/3-ketoacid CoA transferase beta subunit